MPSLPSSLALTNIADGTQIVAVDHRNNYGSVQTAVNALIAALSGGVSGQYLTATSPSAIAWGAAPAPVSYRKTTQKQVVSSVTETDLLNSEITVAAGALGASGCLAISCAGDYLNNTGGTLAAPRLKLKLGGTVLLDSGAGGASQWVNSAVRGVWRLDAVIQNLTAATQQVDLSARLSGPTQWNAGQGAAATVGLGYYQCINAGLATLEMGASGAIDTTAARLLELSVTLPANNSNCDMRLNRALVQVL